MATAAEATAGPRVVEESLASRTLRVNGALVSLDANGRAIFTPPTSGLYPLEATATDLDGYSTTTTQFLRVRDPLDVAALSRHMIACATGEYDLGKMGEQSRRIVASMTPDRAAESDSEPGATFTGEPAFNVAGEFPLGQ